MFFIKFFIILNKIKVFVVTSATKTGKASVWNTGGITLVQ